MTSTHRTADEAKAENIRLMGNELGAVYAALWQEVARLHSDWSNYETLFGSKESRVDLLNAAAPAFSRLVQDSIWENVLLQIARLTDKAITFRKPNLTIQRVAPLISRSSSRSVKRIESSVQTALTNCAFARDWRNRHIAHNDLDLKISNEARPLDFASRQSVKLALASLSEVLNNVAKEYFDSTTFFDTFGAEDALSLLYVIDDGLRARERRHQRLLDGVFDKNEHEPRDV